MVASLIIALGIYSATLYIKLKQIIVDNQEEQLYSLALAASRDIALWLDGKKKEIATLSESISLIGDNQLSISTRLKIHAKSNPEYEMVFYADRNGNALTSSDFKTNIADRSYFQQALVPGKEVVSDTVISRETGNPVVSIVAPAGKGGEVIGVVGCTISLDYLSQRISPIKPMNSGYAFIVQEDGTTIIHPDKRFILKHNVIRDVKTDPALKYAMTEMKSYQGRITTYTHNNIDKYAAFAPVEGTSWTIAINVPVNKVLEQLTPINRLIIITPVFVIILASVLISFLLIIFIVRPIVALKKAMSKVEKGDLDVRIGYMSRDEIGQLTVSFNQMIQTLKHGREKLEQSEEKYRNFFENSVVGVFQTSPEGQFISANPFLARLLGFESPHELISYFTNIDEQHYANSRDRDAFRKTLEKENFVRDFETELLKKDGTTIWASLNARTVRDDAGTVLYYEGILEDITDRKRSEIELSRRSEAMEASIDGMTILNKDEEFTYVNDALARIYGYDKPQELLGKTWQVFYNDKEKERFEKEVLPKLYSEGKWRGEAIGRKKDGSEFSQEVSLTVLNVGGIIGVVRDITDRKRSEKEKDDLQELLHQAQKMESVGRLAGGIAHDFNNMLGVIIGNTEMALTQTKASNPLYFRLKEIMKSAGRSADLTRQLLAFARKQTIAPKVIDLNQTVEGMLKMLSQLIGEDIALAWLPGKDLGQVKMDPSQIDQILANLCVNARDAIKGVGRITIETGLAVFDKTCVGENANLPPGEYIMLTVSDNGHGMKREILDRVFEPFFTTKNVGKGTGLGLPTVYGIVKQNNGLINVYSEHGKGTTFRIYLPRHESKADHISGKAANKPPTRGHETILLVEDEFMILDISRSILAKLGYTVLVASTPGEAIRLAEEYDGDIHLLLTDVVMPEMNCRDMAECILKLYPGLRCLFMSGYTADVIDHQGVLDEDVFFIQKPFSLKDLAGKVREALER